MLYPSSVSYIVIPRTGYEHVWCSWLSPIDWYGTYSIRWWVRECDILILSIFSDWCSHDWRFVSQRKLGKFQILLWISGNASKPKVEDYSSQLTNEMVEDCRVNVVLCIISALCYPSLLNSPLWQPFTGTTITMEIPPKSGIYHFELILACVLRNTNSHIFSLDHSNIWKITASMSHWLLRFECIPFLHSVCTPAVHCLHHFSVWSHGQLALLYINSSDTDRFALSFCEWSSFLYSLCTILLVRPGRSVGICK